MAALISKNTDPNSEFLFLDQKNGYGMLRKISWSSIQDGSFFKELK
jgi:hypothetical protein